MLTRWPAAIVGFLLATAAMLWPAYYNGQAFFFSDTTAYVRGADAAVQRLTGVSTEWTPKASAGPGDSVSSVADKTVLSGRSIYYGSLLYAGERTGGMAVAIALQAAVLVLALFAALSTFDLDRWPYRVLLLGVVALFTAAPLYASFLMPDIFSGLTILACGILLTCDLKGRTAIAAFWFVLLAAALTFHTTHVILAAMMLGLGALLYVWRRPLVIPRGLGAIGVALGVAYLCGSAFNFAVAKLVGEPPLSPPFLMARLIDDGPGYRYLLDTCPKSGFTACNFLDRLPMQSDDFLWSKTPGHGAFASSAPDVRRALSHEQFRFALAVIAHTPWEQAKASLRNAFDQSVLLGAAEFSYTAGDKMTFADKVPESYFDAMQKTPAYTGQMPVAALTVLSYSSTAIGLVGIAGLLIFGRKYQGAQSRPIMQLTLLVLFGVVLNAIICGVISGPHDRYEARVAWLVPAIALIAHFRLYRTWWDRKFSALLPGPAA